MSKLQARHEVPGKASLERSVPDPTGRHSWGGAGYDRPVPLGHFATGSSLVLTFGLKVTYSVRLQEQAFDGDLGQIRHRISE